MTYKDHKFSVSQIQGENLRRYETEYGPLAQGIKLWRLSVEGQFHKDTWTEEVEGKTDAISSVKHCIDEQIKRKNKKVYLKPFDEQNYVHIPLYEYERLKVDHDFNKVFHTIRDEQNAPDWELVTGEVEPSQIEACLV